MRSTAKFLVLLLAVQTVCLGVGLWVQHRFEAWSLRQAVVHDAAVNLADDAREVIDELAAPSSAEVIAEGTSAEGLHRILALAAAKSLACMVVDSENRVAASCDADGRTKLASSPGVPLEFTPVESTEPVAAGVELIELKQPDGIHLAALLALSGTRHKLIIHEPKALALSRAAKFSASMTMVRLLCITWIIAVLSVAFYTMMSRYMEHLACERRRTGGRHLRHGDTVVRTRDAVIFGLAKLAESRDPDTGDHLERISAYAKMLATVAQRDARFAHQITPVFVRNIGLSSALHDIGKVGIEDRVLLKPGPLTPEERVHMQSHVTIGGQCLRDIEQRLGGSNFLQMAREIALCHHECWDGSGYPEGVSRRAIPLAARIVAIADFYDALSTRRVYKEAFPHERCKRMIREESGRRFDPGLVEIWLTIESRFAAVAERFSITKQAPDTDTESAAQQAELQCEPAPVGTTV